MIRCLIDEFGEFLDTQDLNPILVYSTNEIGKLETRQGFQSTDFEVLPTVKNQRLLGYANIPQSASKSYKKRISAKLYRDNTILSIGFLQVVSISKKSFKLCFFAGNSEWFSLVKDIDLRDVDYNDLEHLYNSTAFVNSWANSLDYIYPIVNYGRLDFKTPNTSVAGIQFRFDPIDLFPALFVHAVVRRVGLQIGYKFLGGFFESSVFKDLLLPFSKKGKMGVPLEKIEQFSGGAFGYNSYAPNQQNIFNFTSFCNIPPYLSGYVPFFCFPNTSNFNLTLDRFVCPKTGSYTIGSTVVANITNGDPAQTIVGTQEVRRNNAIVASRNITGQRFGVWVDLNLTVGDVIDLRVRHNNGRPTENIFAQLQVYPNIKSTINPNDTVSFLDFFPSFPASDLFRDLAGLFGVVFQTNVIKREVYGTFFKDIIKNLPNAYDWTNKFYFDESLEEDFTRLISNYGRRCFFSWADGVEDEIEQYERNSIRKYGQGFFDIDNDFIDSEADIFQTKIAPTIHTETFGGNLYLPLIRNYTNSTGTTFAEPKNRMLLLAGRNVQVKDFFIRDNTYSSDSVIINFSDSTIGASSVPYATFAKRYLFGDVNNYKNTLSFGQLEQSTPFGTEAQSPDIPLLEKYYELYARILNETVYLSVQVRLNEVDFANLDFTKPVWIGANIQSYFVINRIERDLQGEFANVELIRIPEK